MTEPDRGESYLEVQMDRSTIVLAALALLACLVVAFLLGSWMGSRKARMGDPAGVATSAGDLEMTGATGIDPDSPGEDVDAEPMFGGRPVSAAGAPALTAVPAPPAVQAPAAGSGTEPSRRIVITSDVDDADGASPASKPAATTPQAAKGIAAAPTKSQQAAAPRSAPAAESAAATAPAGTGWVIQVSAVKVQSQAEALRKRLDAKGYPVRVAEEGGYFKVLVGPYAKKSEAQAVEAKLKRERGLDTWIKRA